MGTDASVFALMQVPRRRAQQCDGSHGWRRAPARIVERSHPGCRKPVRRLFPLQPCHRHAVPRIAAAWAPGVDRATVLPLRIHGQGPPLARRIIGDARTWMPDQPQLQEYPSRLRWVYTVASASEIAALSLHDALPIS